MPWTGRPGGPGDPRLPAGVPPGDPPYGVLLEPGEEDKVGGTYADGDPYALVGGEPQDDHGRRNYVLKCGDPIEMT